MRSNYFHLDELAQLVQGELIGQPDLALNGLASLEQAQANQIAFVNGDKHLNAAQNSKAGALIVTAEMQTQLSHHQNFIVVANPYLAFAILTHKFEIKITQRGIERTAQISPSAIVADDTYIGQLCCDW